MSGNGKLKWKEHGHDTIEGYVTKSFRHPTLGDALRSDEFLIKKWSNRISKWLGVKVDLSNVKEFFPDFTMDFRFEDENGIKYRIYLTGENQNSAQYSINKYKK